MPRAPDSLDTDVLVVGAGPTGSATAAWAARAGLDVLLIDAATFPRDKPCGDGLTPRAVHELQRLGLGEWLSGRAPNWGLRAGGFGRTWYLPWPGGTLPAYGSAVPRVELDATILAVARDSGARLVQGQRAVDVERDGGRITGVRLADGRLVTCRRLVVADGARSQLGRRLGRVWHQDTAYGVAARSYVTSERSDDPWISSHLELRNAHGQVLSGYGWIFPLGDGTVNLGVGTLATDKNPADVHLRSLISLYADQQTDNWALTGAPQRVASALLPMGGAVSGIAGSNWLLAGDAAGCVNPLNGEGIDYGLETGRLAAQALADGAGLPGNPLDPAWPALLRNRYGTAFSLARRLAGLLTVPHLLPTLGPVGMRSRALMTVALRVMGNLVVEEDTDTVARAWRTAGRGSLRLDERPPFPAADLRRAG